MSSGMLAKPNDRLVKTVMALKNAGVFRTIMATA
jgi:hypothetical protein